MKHTKIFFSLLLTCALGLVLLSGCGAPAETPDSGIQTPQLETEASEELTPAYTGIFPRASFNLPYLGLSVTLPEEVQTAMLDLQLFMAAREVHTMDGSAVDYALLTWDHMDDTQRAATIPAEPVSYQQWLDSLTPVARLGVYSDSAAQRLEELTGLTQHQHLGDSSGFHYYLSTNPEAQQAPLLEALTVKIYKASALLPGDSAFAIRKEAITNLGSFTMHGLDATVYTEELFAENKLTMVNLFATWCGPCVKEIPELQKLSQEMAGQGVGVIGVVLDGVDHHGQVDPNAIDKALQLMEKTGATYPFLIPDATAMNGRLVGISAVPETFFVDSEGNIVGDVYPGARNLESWKSIVELELDRLEAN